MLQQKLEKPRKKNDEKISKITEYENFQLFANEFSSFATREQLIKVLQEITFRKASRNKVEGLRRISALAS